MMDDRPGEEVAEVLDDIVHELLDQAGVQEPPVDVIVLAQQHLGMTISLDSRQHERGRVQRAGRKPQIFLRPEPREERHQWTVAHEIGRHLKEQILERLNLDADAAAQMTGESLMTLFCSRLLVPSKWFREDAPDLGFDLLKLKARYRTSSHEVIALRFLDLPEPTIITVLDNAEISRRKSNGPKCKAKELKPIEQKCWKYVNNHAKPHEESSGAWLVQGWPIHQEDWKREILRSLVAEQ